MRGTRRLRATSGFDRAVQEALRIGRVLAEIAPTEAEVHGLVALMEFQSSRFKSRVNAEGSLSCSWTRIGPCGIIY